MLVKELVYMILDELHLTSDDAYFTEEHIIFLIKKYRSFLIKKEQEKEKSSTDVASEFEYQQICLDLEKEAAIEGDPCLGGYYLKTTQKIPKILEGTQPRIYPIDYFQGINICFIPRDRMRYVGTNKYLKNIIYVALGPDLRLTLSSSNPQFMYLKKLRMSAIFEDFDDAVGLLCDNDGDNATPCDVLDGAFPIRDYLVPPLIELVVKELSPKVYAPTDEKNNAKDDMPGMVNRG